MVSVASENKGAKSLIELYLDDKDILLSQHNLCKTCFRCHVLPLLSCQFGIPVSKSNLFLSYIPWNCLKRVVSTLLYENTTFHIHFRLVYSWAPEQMYTFCILKTVKLYLVACEAYFVCCTLSICLFIILTNDFKFTKPPLVLRFMQHKESPFWWYVWK